jgi:16S rRNA (cytosine1402-N4)-methyltransferase
MVPQVLEVLHPVSGDIALDLTVGTGGHALALAAAVGPGGLLVGIDADSSAVEVARARLEAEAPCPCKLFVQRFSTAPEALRRAGVEACDVATADLGVGTHQLLQPQRGFSFDSEEKLDMRYNASAGPSAWEVVNQTSERELADVFHRFGEERYSRQIAAGICRRRRDHTIDTPAELSALVKAVVARRTPRRRTWRIHPATRVMMALRILVNREMEELDALLEILPGLLRRGGRVAVLTYHSLEARRVKQAWRQQSREGAMELLTPSPLRPSPEQIKDNRRIRSAQLRAARKP